MLHRSLSCNRRRRHPPVRAPQYACQATLNFYSDFSSEAGHRSPNHEVEPILLSIRSTRKTPPASSESWNAISLREPNCIFFIRESVCRQQLWPRAGCLTSRVFVRTSENHCRKSEA